MKATATVSSKGQVTLPREVRERLGVEKGDKLEFTLDEQGIHLRPVRSGRNPFLSWLASRPAGRDADFENVRVQRHEGLSEQEIAILRQGPGARVVRIADLYPELEGSGSEV